MENETMKHDWIGIIGTSLIVVLVIAVIVAAISTAHTLNSHHAQWLIHFTIN
jgi:hypothetical protein